MGLVHSCVRDWAGLCIRGKRARDEKEPSIGEAEEYFRNDGDDLPNRIAEASEDGDEILANLGQVVKGGKYQTRIEMAKIRPSDYVILDGVQYAIPYIHDQRINWREPWLGRPILETLMEHFCTRDREYWENEVAKGRLNLREGPLTEKVIWEKGRTVWHTQCVHESPIADMPIQLIAVNSHHVVVNKPPSTPVHPCGRYHRNSLMFLLASQHSLRTLKIVHRLDKLVSGVQIFGRTAAAAREFHDQNRDHQLRKTYVAEVDGAFPCRKTLVCAEPLKFSGVKSRVDPTGKEAFTTYTWIHYKEETNTTVVRAEPRTGRQHQIRAHVAHLGFPIVNDPIYNERPPKVRPDATHTVEDPRVPDGKAIRARGEELLCVDCPMLFPKSFKTVPEPIHLHAVEYKGPTFCYSAEVPDWAKIGGRSQTKHYLGA